MFTFLLAITKVNIMLACSYFYKEESTVTDMLNFQKSFAKALIYNDYYKEEIEKEANNSRKSQRLSAIA